MFHPAVAAWFDATFDAPTPPQARTWPLVRDGKNVLVFSQTGSGKTLAAFLACVDRLVRTPPTTPGTRVVYVSPLKALANDVERNLERPLDGIVTHAQRLGISIRRPTVAVRTGDTPHKERARFARTPTDILITTPESLALLLTSKAQRALRMVDTVIVDEIHALVPHKRGAHLAITLERLAALTGTPLQRIGLSATQRPLEEVALFLGGIDSKGNARDVDIVDARTEKKLELSIAHTLTEPVATSTPASPPSILLGTGPSPAVLAGAPQGTWATIPPMLVELARTHTSVLVFVNARRLAERLAATVNDVAGETLARSHHGSLSRAQRAEVEEAVRDGNVRMLIATSSMELGIDLKDVDLVVQIEAPPTIAAGLQRVGRAGHQVGATSRGVFMPRTMMDVLRCAALLSRMRDGDVEHTHLVEGPIDVLAQHIVGMVCTGEHTADAIYDVVRGAAAYRRLARATFDAVVDMLCGKADTQDGLLRARIRRDVHSGLLVPRAGAHFVAVQNIGTIPDRGLFGVYLRGGDDEKSQKLGELDEEMVFECQVGEAVRLGASSWRIDEITHDRVFVTPAPGVPGKLPFWRGEQPMRPLATGKAIGSLIHILSELSNHRAFAAEHQMHDDAAAALLAWVQKQKAAHGGVVPDDTTFVIERSRDELGDWRVCVLSPLGARVLSPLAMLLVARASSNGVEIASSVDNDGIIMRFPNSDAPPDLFALWPRAQAVDDDIVELVSQSALFSARFREAAARSLLLPTGGPRKRAALWQQRRRAKDLLDAVRDEKNHPITLEAAREVLFDIFDLPGLSQILNDVSAGARRVVTVDVSSPSPMAARLVQGFVRANIYEGDLPAAERRAHALSLDLDQLKELLGEGALRDLLDADLIADVEATLQRTRDDLRCRHADDVFDLLLRIGPHSVGELQERTRTDIAAIVDELVHDERAAFVTIAGEQRLAASDDVDRYLDVAAHIVPLVRREVRAHAISTANSIARRLGVDAAAVAPALRTLVEEGKVQSGAFQPGGHDIEFATSDTLHALRKRSLVRLQREAAPVDADAFVRARLRMAGIHPIEALESNNAANSVFDDVMRAVTSLQGLALPWSTIEKHLLPVRVPGYRAEHLDSVAAAGDVTWTGVSARGDDDALVRLFVTSDISLLLYIDDSRNDELTASEQRVLDTLRTRGASFITALSGASQTSAASASSFASWQARKRSSEAGFDDDTERALWALIFRGVVTSDGFFALRARQRSALIKAREAKGRPTVRPPLSGRFSLVQVGNTPSPTARAVAVAQQVLHACGVVSNEGVSAIASDLAPVTAVKAALRALEDQGLIRRGLFVEGARGLQYATPDAVEALRAKDRDEQSTFVVAAIDPAQPFGVELPWPPARGGTPMRAHDAVVVIADGAAVGYLAKGKVLTFDGTHAGALVSAAKHSAAEACARGLAFLAKTQQTSQLFTLHTIDDLQAHDDAFTAHPLATALCDLGFSPSAGGLVWRPV